MPQNYTGDPTATQAPAAAPSAGDPPILSLPVGSDVPTVSTIYQAFKCLADYSAFAQQFIGQTAGMSFYSASRTYQAGNTVVCAVGGGGGTGALYTYRAKAGVTAFSGVDPVTDDGTHWERWGYSEDQLALAIHNTNYVGSGGPEPGHNTGRITLPGGFTIQWEYLDYTYCMGLSETGTSRNFTHAYDTICYFAFVLNSGPYGITATVDSKTACTLQQIDDGNKMERAMLISCGK